MAAATAPPSAAPSAPSAPSSARLPASDVVVADRPRAPRLLAKAASALDRTQSAFAGRADARLRPRPSLHRLSVGPDFLSSVQGLVGQDRAARRSAREGPSTDASPDASSAPASPSPSRPARQPPRPPPADAMHQTSSRLLRMTDDDRPFTRDFKDLFSTLVVSLLPLSPHRVRLTKVEHTFLSEDAINNLGSLKFSQSNRMPDPKDPSRIVTTTTTTTFSMARDMARSICQRFLDARFIESADGKYQQAYTVKGSVWRLTGKGARVLDRFCNRNGIQQKQVAELIVGATTLVILERDSDTDKLVSDPSTVEVIFRRFMGANGLNIKSSVSAADAESLSEYRTGLTGVRVAAERKINGKIQRETFNGKAAVDWLMDCCTTVDRREPVDMATSFLENGLVEAVIVDKDHAALNPARFQPLRSSIYQLTPKGKDVVSGVGPRGRPSENGDGGGPALSAAPARGPAAAAGPNSASAAAAMRDSNTQRLERILKDPALRLLFRENLQDTHCEENLSFYLDVGDFVRGCEAAMRAVTAASPAAAAASGAALDSMKEVMAQAYGIYNAYLAPGSPCELNIDHQLRNNLATRMTKVVGENTAMIDTLREVLALFEDAQNAVFKLMASDSVPKFLRSPKYEQTLRHYDIDSPNRGGDERSQSRSVRA